jgi:hypothetical protein
VKCNRKNENVRKRKKVRERGRERDRAKEVLFMREGGGSVCEGGRVQNEVS